MLAGRGRKSEKPFKRVQAFGYNRLRLLEPSRLDLSVDSYPPLVASDQCVLGRALVWEGLPRRPDLGREISQAALRETPVEAKEVRILPLAFSQHAASIITPLF